MELLHPDQVAIAGNHFVDRAAILEIFAPDRGVSVLRIPLEERRKQLDAIPWVAQATVRRALPNTLQVDITERTPIAFLRQGSGLSLVDIHGVILESPQRNAFQFPVVTGIQASMTPDDRETRMELFAGFMQGVEAARAGAADQVSEVDLSDEHDLRATLTGLQTVSVSGSGDTFAAPAPLLVHFGDNDFQAKYRTLLDKIDEVRAKTGPLDSVDLRFNGELVASPDTTSAPSRTMVAQRVAPKAPVVRAAAKHSR